MLERHYRFGLTSSQSGTQHRLASGDRGGASSRESLMFCRADRVEESVHVPAVAEHERLSAEVRELSSSMGRCRRRNDQTHRRNSHVIRS